MSTAGFAEIIKAVGHEPLGFYSLVFLILGILCYRLVSNLPAKPKPLDVAVILAIILLGFSGVALALVRAGNRVSEQKEEQQKPTSSTAVIKFIGERTTLAAAQVAFRNSSGQLNFGCGETKSASVTWNAPAGAEQINATAIWTNTDNVKSQDQRVAYSGTTTTATGTISGRDRDWFGNCPGGGHGELVIQGTYQILQPTSNKPFETEQSGSVSRDKPFVIPIPTEQGLHITECEATVVVDGNASPAIMRASPVPAAGSSDVATDHQRGFELSVNGTNASVALQK